MKQPLILPNKLYEQLLKKKNESSRLQSPIDINREKQDQQKKQRPNSSINNFTYDDNKLNKSNCVNQLLQKIKSEKLFNKDKLQVNHQIIEKQYQQLIEQIKKKPLLIKLPRSISNPDIIIQQNYKINVYGKSQSGINFDGQNKINQDVFKIIRNFIQKDWYFQVSDGHGQYGHKVAQFIKEVLPQIIQNDMNDKKNIDRILIESFKKTNDQLLKSGIDVRFSGSTTIIIIIKDNELICANIGDSRAILGRQINKKKLQIIELSKDHKPDLFLEQTRILNRGGRIQSYIDENGNNIGPARVWLKYEDIPGLAMSRSFGDIIASSVGVICEPEIIIHRILPYDKFIIIASDGVWEYLTNEQVIQVVQEYNGDTIKACNKIIDMAQQAWQQEDEVIDDITIIIVYINN